MKKIYRRSISGLMALLICFTTILGGGITAFAASSSGEVAKSYSIGFPRSGDANLDYSGTWGHDELHYMNGWTSGEATWMTTLHTIGSFDGPACYCIEPGVPRLLEKTYVAYVYDGIKTILPDTEIKVFAEITKTSLVEVPTVDTDLQGKVESSLWIFIDDATFSGHDLTEFKAKFNDYLTEHQLYGMAQLVLLNDGKIAYPTKYNYTDYLSEEHYVVREILYVNK